MSDSFEVDARNVPTPLVNSRPSINPPGGLWELARCLWTHNPFYLISLALVLHSARLWHHDAVETFNPWPLMSIIGGYLLLVSITGFLLIKLGRVWDDARSIFLVILLLFVQLSLIFDGIVIRDQRSGAMLLLSGWSAAVVVSECLLLGLRIRMPWTYRGPYHLLLALMFLYPLLIVSGPGAEQSVVWRIFWFPTCVAGALILLLPAVHRGRGDVAQNGTPWAWPWYPWTLFGFFAICLGLRAWALTLSFDPVTSQGLDQAMQMQGTFGGYFLVPIVLAVGILMFEAGLVERSRPLQIAGLLAPWLCLILAQPWLGVDARYLEFRSQFTARFGSPVWVSLNLCWLFHIYALARGVKPAVLGVVLSAVAIMLYGRAWPNSVYVFGAPALPLLVTSGFVLLWSLTRRDSRVFVVGILGAYLATRDLAFGIGTPLLREALAENVACLAILFSGLLFQDEAAKWWQRIGALLLAMNCALAAVLPATLETDLPLPPSVPLAYCWAVTVLLLGYAYVTRMAECRSAAVGCLVISLSRSMLDFAELMKKTFHWDGALYFVVGLAAFVIAVLISTMKSARPSMTAPPASIGDLAEPT